MQRVMYTNIRLAIKRQPGEVERLLDMGVAHLPTTYSLSPMRKANVA